MAINPIFFNLNPQTDPQTALIDPSQLQAASVSLIPQAGISAPGAFAGFLSNPDNVNAVAPYVADRHTIKPHAPSSFYSADYNPWAPGPKALAPDQAKAMTASWFTGGQQPPTQSRVLPPVQPGQPINTPPPASNPASWFQPSAQTTQDQAQLRNLQTSGAGLNGIKNPVARGFARAGDIAASILLPHAAQYIPGTTAHNLQLQGQQQGRINNDVAADQARNQAVTAGLQAQDTAAQIAQRNAQTAQIPILTRAKQLQAQQQLAKIGYKPVFDENNNQIGQEPDPDSPIYQRQQAQNDYFKARKELADAQADLAKAKNDPNSPAFKQAQQRVNTAMTNANTAIGKLGLSEKNYTLKAYGTDMQGNPLPGALQDDDGNTVGTAFNKNVAPTGQERNKKDLATSADEQLSDIKSIIQKHPTMFGPGYGQSSQFRQWLGSQDPDAQRFIAARTIAGDHLAGVFGGRSEAALDALDRAIGRFKDNPQAALAGVDQLSKANKSFIKAGTVPKAKGALGASAPGKSGGVKVGDKVALRNGKTVIVKAVHADGSFD